jgi:type VI secretion system secreted protein VgrG
MSTFTQAERSLSVTSPLGKDVLLLLGFTGTEALSSLFTYQLELASEKEGISPVDIVGKGLTWSVRQIDAEPRHFHGVVSRFAAGTRGEGGLWHYRVEAVPWLWFLTRTTNCRIFQNKKAPEIIEEVFKDLGFTDFKSELKGSFAVREYCVQYRETAFQFVSRIMEAEGIFYYFRHEEGKHTLVLANHPSSYFDCREARVKYSRGSLAPNHIHSWEHQYELRSGKWTRTDYNFETPSTSLLTSTGTVLKQPGVDKLELFDYPGDYFIKGDGEPVTKIRMQEEEVPYDVVSASSKCCTFTPCGRFTLENHDVDAETGPYVITAISHAASEASYGPSTGGAEYTNTFTCIRDSVHYRPPRVTPRAVVRGPQTAVVTGPAGEEIFVDKYGRVKVQFFWDRLGKKNENSSCWIRVAEQWAGKNWGLVAHPRIGQEVVVDFLEGDPDRPLITGRVYNAEQMPPYGLPGSKTQSGIKSRSSLKGTPDNFNEIRFEDKIGLEQLYIHAEKNQDIEVENDETHWVGHDRKKTIDNDETTHVKHDRTETVDNNETITIHGNRTEEVDKDETITIHGNRTESVDKNEVITVTMTRTRMVGINESVNVGAAQEITVGGLRAVTVGLTQAITVGGSETETYGKNHTQMVGSNQSVTVAKDGTYKIGANRGTNVVKNDTLQVGKELMIQAGDHIILTTGKSSITMKKDGTITISGKDITITATGEIAGKATKNMTLKAKKILHN